MFYIDNYIHVYARIENLMDIIPQVKSITKDVKQKGKDPRLPGGWILSGTLVLHTSHERPHKC